MSNVEMIAMDMIDTDQSTQVRACFDQDAIKEYTANVAALPPLDLFFDRNVGRYFIGDGWHRYYAHDEAGSEKIPAIVHAGGQRDALRFALKANQSHGLRRTNADKRRAVEVALDDAEWAQWSNRAIAEMCAVGTTLVDTIRKELAPDIPDTQLPLKGTCTEDHAAGNVAISDGEQKPRPKLKRKGKDGKSYDAKPKRKEAKPEDFDPDNLEKGAPAGKEKITPQQRKEAKAAWGVVVRFCDAVGCAEEVKEEIAGISSKLKVHWGAGIR